MSRRLKSRQPFLDRTNNIIEIADPKMTTIKQTVVLRKPSARVKKSTDWKRRVPGEISPPEKITASKKANKKDIITTPVKQDDRRVVKVSKRKRTQVKDEIISPRVKISPKKTTKLLRQAESSKKQVPDRAKEIVVDKFLLTPKVIITPFDAVQIGMKKNAGNVSRNIPTRTSNNVDPKLPTNISKSPANVLKSPKKVSTLISNTSISPKKFFRSPTRTTITPKIIRKTPTKITKRVPARRISKSPANVLKSPQRVSKLISNISISPKKFFRSPTRTAITPKNLHKTPTKIAKRVPARAIATKLKKSVNTTVKNAPQTKTLPKRLASKNAITKIVSALRGSVDSNSTIAQIKDKPKEVLDVYDFTFDSDEEPFKKTEKGRLQEIIDDSGDENNSMKGVVHHLRKMEKRNKKTVTKKPTKSTKKVLPVIQINYPVVKNDEIKNPILKNKIAENKPSEELSVVKKVTKFEKPQTLQETKFETKTKLQTKFEKPQTLQEKICDSFINDDFDNYDDNYQDLDSPEIITENKNEKLQKTITEEICDSFIASLEETSTHLSPGKMLSDDILNKLKTVTTNKSYSPKINVISNVIVQNRNKSNVKNIINSTTNSIFDESNPWRLSISNIRNTHTFTVKDKSFIPNYDQEIVINSTFTEKLKPSENASTPKKIPDNKFTYQSSILNFVSSSRENKNEIMKAGSLFQSPRKILGEINFTQSTPFHPSQKIQSPNFSVISSEEKTQRNEISNLFGFSYDENSENIDPKTIKKFKKRSPKKEKLKAVLFNDVVQVKNIEEREVKEIEAEEKETLSSQDIELLFQDVKNDKEKLQVKKSRRSYVRSRPKRRRLPSIESNESDNDSIAEVKIKFPNKRTKKEEEEADRLASHYNSMFEEIDKFDLIID